MPPQLPEDDTSSLERARQRLYKPGGKTQEPVSLPAPRERELPHEWKDNVLKYLPRPAERHVHLASIFLVVAVVFFLFALGAAGYLFYYGGNAVSVDKIAVDMQGPTTIAGGDIVPLALTITNRNSIAINNATIEIDFPNGTRSAADVLQAYPRYTENLGTLASGASVTRTIKAVVFGAAGQTLSLPVSFSYGAAGTNAVFVKKSSYPLIVSTTPLSVSVSALSETVSGQPLTFTLTVRSNASVPLNNVVLSGAFPFGFSVTQSSLPVNNSSFLLGTIPPGSSKTLTLTGTLTGQDTEQRVFHFTVGTAKTANDQTLAVSYMTQDASVTLRAPFINTTLALNGDSSPNVIVAPGALQSVTLSYANTLTTSITNATVAVTISGTAVDYNSIQSSNGFYRSTDHSVLFSRDTDPALAMLAPGASGIGTFTFRTPSQNALASLPTITFTISVSGTRVGQSNVPEQVTASVTKTAKVATVISLSASSLHASGPFGNNGPIPPRANQATTYTVLWNVRNAGSPVAGSTVTTTLPSYVTYINVSSGAGSFSYDEKSRALVWSVGDLPQGGSAQGAFQVSFTPSTSQQGSVPNLTGSASLSGFDRFAGIQVSATADPATTDTTGDPGSVRTNAIVQ